MGTGGAGLCGLGLSVDQALAPRGSECAPRVASRVGRRAPRCSCGPECLMRPHGRGGRTSRPGGPMTRGMFPVKRWAVLAALASPLPAQTTAIRPKLDTTVEYPKDHIVVPITLTEYAGSVQSTLS